MAGGRLARGARALVVISLVAALGTSAGAQGAIERAKDEVHGEDDDDEAEEEEEGVEGSAYDVLESSLYTDDPLGTLAGWLFFPFTVPRMLLGDDGGEARFGAYPYRAGAGYWNEPEPDGSDDGREWSFRPRAEAGSDFDDLERIGLGLQVEHASRFGLDASWSLWREDVGDGEHDDLDLADANLVYRFAQRGPAAFRVGLGLNVADVADETEYGVNSTYGLDLLPDRPFFAAAEIDFGTLGDATQTHWRAELGFVLERFNFFASFDHVDIDSVELRSYSVGLRAWL